MENEGMAHRHEHAGRSSKGDFDDLAILNSVGLSKGHCFLDAGCGEGHFSLTASGLVGDDGIVFALDLHPPSLEALKAQIDKDGAKNIRPLLVDMTKGIPLETGSIDMVLMSNVLHGLVHNNEAAHVISEVVRVLRDGGRLVIIEFRKESTPYGPPLNVRLSIDEVRELMGGYALQTEGQKDLSGSHFMSIHKKGGNRFLRGRTPARQGNGGF